ncbi:MAG: FtsX-like permease family protein [Oscillospiraceae bacterium]
MKKTMFKNTFRSIKNTFGRFIAIFAIIALGSGFFSGIKAACPDMKKNAWNYYNEHNLDDIHIMSTLGFEQNEVDELNVLGDDITTESAYSADLFIESENVSRKAVKLYSYDTEKKMNIPELVEGRLPESADECVVDYKFRGSEQPQIGEKVRFSPSGEDDISDTLSRTEYTVVGYVKLPMYISFERGTTSIGNGNLNGYVLIPEENFCLEVYTDVYVKINGTEKLDPFTEDYETFIDDKIEQIEAFGETEIEKRVKKITDEAYEEINDAKAEVADSQKEIEEAKEKLTDGEIEYNDGLRSVDNLNSVIDQLNQILADYETDAVQSVEEVTDAVNTLDQGDFFAADETLEQLLTGYMTIPAAYDNGTKAACRQGIEQYISGLEENVSEIEDSLAEARAELDDAASEIKDGEEKLTEAQEDIAEAEREVAEKTEDAKWYVFSRDEIYPSFGNYGDDCDKVDAIAKVFPVFFILIAALVCWTTMTRMVEEQRTQTGTFKALGYGYGDIMGQYILYAVLASIPGVALGVTLGIKTIPKLIFTCYKALYAFDDFSAAFKWDYAIGCAIAACLCTGLSSFMACRMELISKPAELMRPKPPKNGKRIILEKLTFIWSRLKFTTKVTFRNLFRYKSRVIMMIIGIGGCTALLLTGFGLRHSIVSIVDRQYSDVFVYDAIIAVDDEEADYDAIKNEAESTGLVEESMYAMQKVDDLYSDEGSAEVYFIVPDKIEDITKFFDIHNRVSREHYELSDSGIIINEKLARLLGVKIGDSVYFEQGHSVKVSGIMENYTFNYAFINSDGFDKLGLDYELTNNVLFLNMNDTSKENELSEAVVNRDDVLAVSYSSNGSESFRTLVSSLSFIVILVIVCAGALAFVVMFNLTNINVNERIHELATIKVLGFYDGEVAAYIYRENTISAFMGMLTGLVVGIFFEKFVIKTCEVDSVMFAPDIPAYCFFAAAGLTIVFAVFVNVMLYFRLKKIDMAASLKSVE